MSPWRIRAASCKPVLSLSHGRAGIKRGGGARHFPLALEGFPHMKTKLIHLLALGLMTFAGLAQAAMTMPSCDAQASEKKLAGAAKTSFLKKCNADMPAAAASAAGNASCDAAAAEKKLAGAAKNSFLKKCNADGGAAEAAAPSDAQAACAAKAAEKKLAGAAKNSFTKKCVADAAGK
ncbi:hypothetical protein DAPPUDRAFT_279727 [Daphnia pulex]|uniref:PsiF repeat-containing protein n=1 Tax=Daphnia pulex TaxID=6669 RepID=E9I7K6_DAPPU|nr:hypothetical protein DAPPUDRAFT_279727 [Daphnia pulex]|eukprot:EFX60024.1 hypothetical protein DAPPUDRAFT_279727 [Daphnia pulex]